MLIGSAYYARDRRPLDGPVHDRIAGGKLHPMPPRTARLGAEGRLPAYESVSGADAAALEEPLAEFLSVGDRRIEASVEPPSPETRERLEALGRLDFLDEIQPAKDWTPGRDGGPRKIVREDLRVEVE